MPTERERLLRYLARQRKKGRLRGHDLELQQDLSSQYQKVVQARSKQKYLDADYKLAHNIQLNIYDAARSYRDVNNEPNRPLREVLKDQRFRNAWGTFKGGYRWEYNTTKHEWIKVRRKEGGIHSTTKEKLEAAKVLGWYGGPISEPVEKLRNISP